MSDDLCARFLPQFIPIARARVAAARAASRQRNHGGFRTVVHELHTLAGEAGLLGLGRLVTLSRDGDHKAHAFEASGSERDLEVLDEALNELAREIEIVAASIAPDAGDEPTP